MHFPVIRKELLTGYNFKDNTTQGKNIGPVVVLLVIEDLRSPITLSAT